MNRAVAGPSGLPGGGGPRTGRHAAVRGYVPADSTVPTDSTVPAATGHDDDADLLLQAVDADLSSLDELDIPDQISVYDRMHTTLADALARTADTGMPPGPGDPGA